MSHYKKSTNIKVIKTSGLKMQKSDERMENIWEKYFIAPPIVNANKPTVINTGATIISESDFEDFKEKADIVANDFDGVARSIFSHFTETGKLEYNGIYYEGISEWSPLIVKPLVKKFEEWGIAFKDEDEPNNYYITDFGKKMAMSYFMNDLCYAYKDFLKADEDAQFRMLPKISENVFLRNNLGDESFVIDRKVFTYWDSVEKDANIKLLRVKKSVPGAVDKENGLDENETRKVIELIKKASAADIKVSPQFIFRQVGGVILSATYEGENQIVEIPYNLYSHFFYSDGPDIEFRLSSSDINDIKKESKLYSDTQKNKNVGFTFKNGRVPLTLSVVKKGKVIGVVQGDLISKDTLVSQPVYNKLVALGNNVYHRLVTYIINVNNLPKM